MISCFWIFDWHFAFRSILFINLNTSWYKLKQGKHYQVIFFWIFCFWIFWSYRRWLRTLLLYLYYVFQALINSPVSWFCMSTLGLVLFQISGYSTGIVPLTQSSNSSFSSLLLASGEASRVMRLMLARVLRSNCWCESVMDTGGLSWVTGLRWTPFRMRANMLAKGSTAVKHKIHIILHSTKQSKQINY